VLFRSVSGTRFREIIDDPYVDQQQVKKVVICTGKIYYDLLEEQQKNERKDVALVRMEQLYPLPVKQLRELIADYPDTAQWCWAQEEPRNMGAWNYILRVVTEVELTYYGRKPSATPASGYAKQHSKEQQEIIDLAFDKISEKDAVRT
jgi:2-oxoglutarate dehydrogenase E1 component